MRPLTLEVEGFGPFIDAQTLDFTCLGDARLFLIHGPTGSGKSTLLDAITYALYGETSGGERSAEQLRSDHIDSHAATRVRLVFALGRATYAVERSPSFRRPKRRGDGEVSENAKASLARLDGPRDIPLATGPREVSEHIRSLLGFEAAQFRQVMVLPQGRFRDLLSSDARAREDIIRTLFRADIYARFQDELKTQRNDLREVLAQQEALRRQLLDQADVDDVSALDQQLASLQAGRPALAAQVDDARKRLDQARGALEQARHAQALLDECTSAERDQQALEARQAAVDDKRRALDAAQRAQAVAPVHDRLDAASERRNASKTLVAQREQLLATAQDTSATADAVLRQANEALAALAPLRDELAALPGQATAIATFFQAHAAFQQAVEAREAAGKQIEVIEQRRAECGREHARLTALIDAARAAEARLPLLRTQRDVAARQAEQAVKLQEARAALAQASRVNDSARTRARAASDAHCDARQAFETCAQAWQAGQAARLAQSLEHGRPCPVCGASEHPAPAETGQAMVADATLQAAQDRLDQTARAWQAAQSEASDALAELKRAQAHLIEREQASASERAVEQDSAELAQAIQACEHAVAERPTHEVALASLVDVVARLETQREAARQALATAATDSARAEERLLHAKTVLLPAYRRCASQAQAEARLRRRATELKDAIDGGEAQAMAAQERANRAREDLRAARERLDVARDELVHAESAAGQAAQSFDTALRAHGFADRAGFEASRRSQAAVDDLIAEITGFDQAKHSAHDRLTRARAAAAAITTAPDIAAAEQAMRAQQERLEHALAALHDNDHRQKTVLDLSQRLRAIDTELAGQRRRYSAVGHLADLADGRSGAARITFERFVLAALLDEVLAAAGQRLKVMSRGRYWLRRAAPGDDRRRHTGLDLEVDDSFTGKARPVATLSGGEGFLASLALALGLADVVQHRSGGVHLDTVFIDEGFGALDPEALDLALRALIDLQAAGRLVGVVSHVAEMRERIDVRLEVRPAQQGSRAQFVLP